MRVEVEQKHNVNGAIAAVVVIYFSEKKNCQLSVLLRT